MISLLVAVVVTATPSKTLAALDLEAQQVPAAVAKLVGTHLTQKLIQKGFQVMTSADLAAMLGVERQKALLGCNEESSCIAEIGAALNAHGVVMGSVGRLGETRLLNVKVLASGSAQSLAVCSGRAGSDEGLLNEAEACADIIAAALLEPGKGKQPEAVVVKPEAPAGPRRTWALAPLVGGAAVAIAGGVMVGIANGQAEQLVTSAEQPQSVLMKVRAAEGLATTGVVLLGVGGAAAVTGAILFLVKPPVQPVAAITPHGAFLGVAGALP
jgi:hypothetical protein